MTTMIDCTGKPPIATLEALSQAHVDVTAPDGVEVVVSADQKTIWVNVNGVCVFRACRIKHLRLDEFAQA